MADGLQVILPSAGWNKDMQAIVRTGTVDSKWDDILWFINLANQYLWFILWVVAFWVLVYAGFKLITARWDEKEMKKLWGTLMWIVIGLFIAIFSYLIIRLVLNLF